MSTLDKAKERVAESLLFKIEACDYLLNNTNEINRFNDLLKTRISLLTGLEDLVLRT